MASEGDHKKHATKLFGVDLSQHYTNLSGDDHPVKAFLGGETLANKEGHNKGTELEGSASKSTSSAQGSKPRVFPCRYCSRTYHNYKALGGHQKAHKNERTATKSNSILNSVRTDRFQYPVVGQQPIHAMFASNRRLSHNFELERVDLSNYQPHFQQLPHNFPVKLVSSSLSSVKRARNDIELESSSFSSVKRARNDVELESPSLSSVKRARNDIELESSSLSFVKRARNDIELACTSLGFVKRASNEDPQQHNTLPGPMVNIITEDVELDFSLHL